MLNVGNLERSLDQYADYMLWITIDHFLEQLVKRLRSNGLHLPRLVAKLLLSSLQDEL